MGGPRAVVPPLPGLRPSGVTSSWPRRPWLGAAAAATRPARTASLLAGVLAVSACSAGPPRDPFGTDGVSFGSAVRAEQGAVFTDGLTVLRNVSGEAVVLRAVAFEDGAPGLELVGVEVAGLERSIGGHQQLPAFPPQSRPPDVELGPLADLDGYEIPAGGEYATKGVELLIGVRRTSPQRASRRALLITYETRGRRATARVRSTLAVCDPGPQVCEQEGGEQVTPLHGRAGR